MSRHRLLVDSSDLDNEGLVWLRRARHGADNSRTPHAKRGPVKTTVRKSVRGSPNCDKSADYWPSQKALNRPQEVPSAAEPQAEPWGAPQDKVAFLDAELVPSARVRASAQKVSSPPQCVASGLWGSTEGVCSSAPDYPLRAMDPPRDCAKLVPEEIGGVWSLKLAVIGMMRSTRRFGTRCSERLRLSNERLVRRTVSQLGVIVRVSTVSQHCESARLVSCVLVRVSSV